MELRAIPLLTLWLQYDVGPPFAPITTSSLLGRLSTRLRGVLMGLFDNSFKSALVRSHTDVGWEGLALSLHCNSSERCSIGFRAGLYADQSSSSIPLCHPCLHGTCFVQWCTKHHLLHTWHQMMLLLICCMLDCSMLKFPDVLRAILSHFFFQSSLHADVLHSIHMWRGQVIRTPDSNHLDGFWFYSVCSTYFFLVELCFCSVFVLFFPRSTPNNSIWMHLLYLNIAWRHYIPCGIDRFHNCKEYKLELPKERHGWESMKRLERVD